jgi:hypothetical protein
MTSEDFTSRPTITGEVIWRQLDDNAVLVSPSSGEVQVLNAVGTIIWRMLAKEQSITDIAAHLANNYQVSPIQAQQDVILFLQELHNRGLIVWPETAVIE